MTTPHVQYANPLAVHKDLEMTAEDFRRVTKMIYEKAGIVLDSSKQEMAYSRLSKRLRLHGMKTFSEYLNKLESQPKAREWESFVNSLTTNLTEFFREAHHFDILSDYAKAQNRPLRIWCCAASHGEEPYSIGITLIEALGQSMANKCYVLATDIDTEALSKADSGIYPISQVNKLPPDIAKKYFLKGSGERSSLARVKHDLFPMIHFSQLNLHDKDWGLREKFDVIFCRNIMIYFNHDGQRKILKGFTRLISPQGMLITGHSENFTYIFDGFKLEGKTVYSLAKEYHD